MEKKETLTTRALLEIGGAFQTSRPLLTAVELDLFTRLGGAKLTAADLAQALGVDERALTYLLDALVAQRLLDKVSGAYQNTPEGRALLVRDAPGSILAALEHYANLWTRWGTLTEVVRVGHPIACREEGAMAHWRVSWAPCALAQESAPGRRRRLASKACAGCSMSVGAASYSIAFAQAEPGLTAVVFDSTRCGSDCRRNIERAGLQERITTQAGNYHLASTFGTGFDLASLRHRPQQLRGGERGARAQVSMLWHPAGGWSFAIFIMSPDRTEPAPGALFAINMLVNTPGGGTFTEAEMRSWPRCCRFLRHAPGRSPGMNALMIGTRKA